MLMVQRAEVAARSDYDGLKADSAAAKKPEQHDQRDHEY